MVHDNLDAIRRDVIDRLARAPHEREAALHTPVVATADADARVMVLRAFDEASWLLRFHTDVRSPKVAVVEADPRIAVLAYDRPAKLQIRLRGKGAILRDGAVVDAAWEESTRFARRCYLGAGPGETALGPTSGLPPSLEGREPDDAELAPARKNFALLMVAVESIDWFCLAHTGHRRAIVTRGSGSWVTP